MFNERVFITLSYPGINGISSSFSVIRVIADSGTNKSSTKLQDKDTSGGLDTHLDTNPSISTSPHNVLDGC